MSDWFDDYGEPKNRKAIVERQIARLITPDTSEHPAVTERKKREAAERLRRHDELFQVWPGATLGVRWSAGDDAAGVGGDD